MTNPDPSSAHPPSAPSSANGWFINLWTFHKLLRWVLPLLLFTLCAVSLISGQRAAGHTRCFAEDATYADMAVVQNLRHLGSYGLCTEQTMPYTDGVLWQIAVYLVSLCMHNLPAAVLLLNYLLVLGVLLVSLRIAIKIFPLQPYIYCAVAVLALSPALAHAAQSGGGLALSMLLILLAIDRHIDGMRGHSPVLPVTAAVYIGLAMLIRIEFALFWVIFFIHALVAAIAQWRPRHPLSMVICRGFVGLVLCSILLWPLIHLNAVVIHVPWPPTIGSSMVLNAAGGAEGGASGMGLLFSHIAESYALMLDSSLAFGLPGLLLFLAGLVLLLTSMLQKGRERTGLAVFFIAFLLPPFYGVVSVFTGWGAAPYLVNSFVSLLILIGVFGLFRFAYLFRGQLSRRSPMLPGVIWGILSVFIVALAFVGFLRFRGEHLDAVRTAVQQRAALDAVVATHHLEGQTLVTDRPGWTAYRYHRKNEPRMQVVDLTGRGSTAVLECVDASGLLDPERLYKKLAFHKPALLILWGQGDVYADEYKDLTDLLSHKLKGKRVRALPMPEHPARFIRINWP